MLQINNYSQNFDLVVNWIPFRKQQVTNEQFIFKLIIFFKRSVFENWKSYDFFFFVKKVDFP